MTQYSDTLVDILPEIAGRDLGRPFEELGVDSFDLLNIRVQFERLIDGEIPDTEWTEFRTFEDLFAYCERVSGGGPARVDATGVATARRQTIGMPHMTVGGLSENWLFRELGDVHWTMLCEGLDQRSSELRDAMDQRLYATFARVQIVSSVALAQFHESEQVKLRGNITRYGNGMYFSDIEFASEEDAAKTLKARLISSFSKRGESGNRNLVKSQPVYASNKIENLASPPEFVEEYRMIKKGVLASSNLLGHEFVFNNDIVTQCEYDLSPYYDVNGAGLLYFASYPTIADTCLVRTLDLPGWTREQWLERTTTIARDILYYANCDLNDAVVFQLNSMAQDGDRYFFEMSLFRKSDNQLMAKQLVVKNLAV